MTIPAEAQERPPGPPSASISIDQFQVAFIGSGAVGSGTLIYDGRSYPLRVGGLGVGGVGVSRLTATGLVYGLHRRTDLAGGYLQLRRGWALAEKGRGVLWLGNGRGVTMRLKARRKGLQLALGADGVVIGFK